MKKKYLYITSLFIFSFLFIFHSNIVKAEGQAGAWITGCDSGDGASCGVQAEVNTGSITTGPGQSGSGNDNYTPDIDKITGADKNAMVNGLHKTEFSADCSSWGLSEVSTKNYHIDTSGMNSTLANLVNSTLLKAIHPGNDYSYCDGNNGNNPTSTPGPGGGFSFGDITLKSSVKEDVDYTRSPHQWLWKTYKCSESLYNGHDESYEGPYHCTDKYEKFPGLSNEFIQEKIIDAGYLDFLLDQKNAERISQGKNPDNRSITERRKDLNVSAFKEDVFTPKTYYSNGDWLTYKSIHSSSSAFNMYFEPFYWYNLQSYAKWHYMYTATSSFRWYKVVNGIDNGSYTWTGWNEGYPTPPSNVWAEAIKNGVPRNAKVSWDYDGKSQEKYCNDYKPDGGCKSWAPKYWHMIYTFTWNQQYTAILGPYTKTSSVTDHTSENTTDFMMMTNDHDYEGVAKLLEGYIENVCDYIPPEVTAKKCRAYYRGDAGISNSDKQMFEQKCPCIELSNLTD